MSPRRRGGARRRRGPATPRPEATVENGEQTAPSGAQPPPRRGSRPQQSRPARPGGPARPGRPSGAGRPERPGRPERTPDARGEGPHNGHGGTPDEVEVEHEDEDDLVEEEIRAHRETTADSKSGPAASPQAVASLNSFLRALGVDPRRDSEYTVTAQLTADFLAERTAALRREPGPLRPSRYRGSAGETVRLERIRVYGMCPHHFVPYFGSVSVKYVPSDRICGIGAIARLVRELSCAPRLQESLTQAIADAIERDLEPASVEVVVRARHLCLEMRGVEQRAIFVTEARRPAQKAPKPEGRR